MQDSIESGLVWCRTLLGLLVNLRKRERTQLEEQSGFVTCFSTQPAQPDPFDSTTFMDGQRITYLQTRLIPVG
jgi:hypothetical protein